MKKIYIILFIFLFLSSCQNELKNNRINASIVPLASISNYILDGEKNVEPIIPAGVSPHGFDLKVDEVKNLVDSDLIIYLGIEHIDNFLNKIIDEKKSLNLYGDDKNNKLDHSSDPHVWTSQKNASILAEKITDKLIELYPNNREEYENNLLAFKFETIELIRAFEDSVEGKTAQSFMVFHDAYNYLFEELGIAPEKKLIFQKSLISDMSIADLKNIEDIIKKNNIKYVFKEPQFNNSSFENFIENKGLKILILDPLGIDYGAKGYIQNLENNLKNIEKIYE